MVKVYGKEATRFGYGEGLLRAAERDPRVVALSADVVESTATHYFKERFPDRYFAMGIAEPNMLGVAAGLSLVGYIPFAAAYSIFVTGRPWEQIRNTVAYTGCNVKICGTHCGLTVGPDGATHQALEDIAIMRAIPRVQVIVPCDSLEARKVIESVALTPGIFYVRLSREAYPVVTREETPYQIGKASVLAEGKDVAIVACGIMVYEALVAAEELAKEGVSARVINLHTIKPLDGEMLLSAADECGALVTAEEHQLAGGMGSAVSEFLVQNNPVPVEMVAVRDSFGESGSSAELLASYRLTARDIVLAAKKVLTRKR